MFKKTLIALFSLIAVFALPSPRRPRRPAGAVVFSKTSTVDGKAKGGLFAVKDGHLNQLTEDPTDTEPNFSPDGRTIAFVRGGDIYSIRPDGSGQRQLTSGPEVDSLPKIAPERPLPGLRAARRPRRPLGPLHASASPAAASTASSPAATTTKRPSRRTARRSSSSARRRAPTAATTTSTRSAPAATNSGA